MSRFGNQLKLRHDMKHTLKTAFLSLAAVLTLTACDRNRHTPDPEKIPLSFTASSQTLPVKASTDPAITPLSQYCEDFGVWGIARRSSYSPYILWETATGTPMEKVIAVHEKDANGNDLPTSNFVPTSGAYWIQGYAYSFIAIAPYTGGAEILVGEDDIDAENDVCSFTLDMGPKYPPLTEGTPEPDFDIMGAAAKTEQVTIASQKGAQNLNFHHLLAQININVQLKDSPTGSQLGTVSKVRLQGVYTKLSYALSCNAKGEFVVQTNEPTSNPQKEVVFTEDQSSAAGFQQSLNVVPQEISDYKLYLDFTLGTDEEAVSFTDFFVDIANASSQPADKKYQRNQVYNWNITISSKAGISFKVSVTPWGEQAVGDEIEIY